MGSPLATEAMQDESFDETLDKLEAEFVMPPDPDEVRTPTDPAATQMQLYSVNMQMIESLKAKCLELTCDTKEGYEATRQMIGTFRTLRGRIEKRRKLLNEEHHEAIRFVNKHAKDLVTFIENLEEPLKAKKLAVDEAKERARKAAELAEQERLAQIERDKLAAQEAERQAAHAAEQERLRQEAEKLAAERAAWVAERDKREAAAAAERDEIETERIRLVNERNAFESEQRRLAKAERDRLAKIEAERLAAEQAERDKQAAAERERLRIEAMPDAESMQEFAVLLRGVVAEDMPEVKTDPAKAVMNRVSADLELIATELESFTV